jgi:hypothetical protein
MDQFPANALIKAVLLNSADDREMLKWIIQMGLAASMR